MTKTIHSIALWLMIKCSNVLGFEFITFRADEEDGRVTAMSFGVTAEEMTLHAHDITRQGFSPTTTDTE